MNIPTHPQRRLIAAFKFLKRTDDFHAGSELGGTETFANNNPLPASMTRLNAQ
jgi:hypothetical protein